MNNNIYMKYKEILNNQKLFFPKEYLLEPVYLEEKQQKKMNNNIFNNSNKSIINNTNNVNSINNSYQAKSLIKGVINSPVVVQPINNIRKNIQENSNLTNKNIQPRNIQDRNNNYLNQNIYLGTNYINRTNLNMKKNLAFNFKLK